MKSYIINVIHIICNIIDNILNYKFYKIKLLLLVVVMLFLLYFFIKIKAYVIIPV